MAESTLSRSAPQIQQRSPKPPRWVRVGGCLLSLYAIAQVLWLSFLCINHINFPLNLEAMELTVLQHLKRVLAGLPLYPKPTIDFIALAYNPLFYYLCVPFTWLLGANLFTLRLVAILGTLGCGIVLGLALYRHSHSCWWTGMGIGLFAAAYGVMDAYLDIAHRESWLLLSILLGCYVLERAKSIRQNSLGLLLLIAGFWLKQQGALFLLGGTLFLLWHRPWHQKWVYALLACLLGPVLYQLMPNSAFGLYFHYFTWQVPRQWMEVTAWELMMLARHVLRSYGLLVLMIILAGVQHLLGRNRRWHSSPLSPNIWWFMLPFAGLSGVAASLTPGSNNNVWIPMGTWFIVVGVLSLKMLTERHLRCKRWGGHILVLSISFLLLWYTPQKFIVSAQADPTYQTFLSFLRTLDGPVYAPDLGQLQSGYSFYPTILRIPLEDTIRGPGVNLQNHPTVRAILRPVLYPQRPAYLLTNRPLEGDRLLNFLSETYTLKTDLGDQFKALQTLPRRYTVEWPRYLYQSSSDHRAT